MTRRLSPCLTSTVASHTAGKHQRAIRAIPGLRHSSVSPSVAKAVEAGAPYHRLEENFKSRQRLFERLSTASLIRSVILGQIFKTPIIFRPGLYVLEKIANSKSALLDADKNPLIRAMVYPLIYKHFCAGRNRVEVQQTIADIKKMGYSGVILCYSREVMARTDSKGNSIVEAGHDEVATRYEVQQWRDGNLETLNTVGAGDYIGVKYTGAGPRVSQDLKNGKEKPCAPVREALDELCAQAEAQTKRLWIDAEQQAYHPTVDKWAIDLMRKYNRDGQVVVLTTIQAYLKSSRQTVEEYLRLAQKEGWSLGIKLVRGAYIASDVRSKIHDTKPETDASYDGIVHDLLNKSWPGFDKASFPHVKLFLAGHNTNSIRKAATLAQRLAREGALSEPMQYGQLQGMADDIGCELLALGGRAKSESGSDKEFEKTKLGAPQAFKCLSWGSVQECLHYLVRRAVENRGAAERMSAGLAEMRMELRRRILRF